MEKKDRRDYTIGELIQEYMQNTGATFKETLDIFELNKYRAKIVNALSPEENEGIKILDYKNSILTIAFESKKPDSLLSTLLAASQEKGKRFDKLIAEGDKHYEGVNGDYKEIIESINPRKR